MSLIYSGVMTCEPDLPLCYVPTGCLLCT